MSAHSISLIHLTGQEFARLVVSDDDFEQLIQQFISAAESQLVCGAHPQPVVVLLLETADDVLYDSHCAHSGLNNASDCEVDIW